MSKGGYGCTSYGTCNNVNQAGNLYNFNVLIGDNYDDNTCNCCR